jgi:hypothetical protein
MRLHGKITAWRSPWYLMLIQDWFAVACDGNYRGSDIQARRADQRRIL